MMLAVNDVRAGMYRWVDSAGRVQYSDTLPPTYQQSGAAEMNKQGLVIKRTASSAERRAEAERIAAEAKRQRATDEQARLDRALTSTYTTEAEIDLSRDRALEHHKLVIKGAEIRAHVVDANTRGLLERIRSLTRSGRKVPPNLQAQLDQSMNERLELKRTLQQNEQAMVQVRAKYDADKQRFRALTATSP